MTLSLRTLRRGIAATLAGAGIAVGSTAFGSSIGLNLEGSGSGPGGTLALAATDTAGVVRQQNWNNGPGTPGSISSLVDNTGSTFSPPASVSWNSNGQWTAIGLNNPADKNNVLMNGYLDSTGGATGNVTFSNVPYGVYDVFVYFGSDGNGRNADFQLNGAHDTYGTTSDSGGYGSFVQATSHNSASPTSGNYVEFTNVTNSSLRVGGGILTAFTNGFEVEWTAYNSSPNNVGVHGVQIVSVPEPGTVVLLGCGLAGWVLLNVRRKAKQSS